MSIKLKSVIMDQCSTCGKTVEETQEALSCDLCSQWEHVRCVRQRERPSGALYQALVECNIKCIMYMFGLPTARTYRAETLSE